MMEHSKKMRMSVKNPSEATLAAWRWEDSKNEMILRYYERQEAAEAAAAKAAKDDDDTFHITTEVKIK